MTKTTKSIRNIAIIAHVDHGKTTLVDALLKQTNVFRESQKEMNEERILDSNDIERERGITILAKNCAITYKDTKINIVDTPGHSDFSGEVERTLGMANSALLVIDAQEGPMPQTRFVLRKALELGLKIIVVINKIDKRYARINYVLKKTENLFLELATEESQLDYPVLYAIGREGKIYNQLPNDLTNKGDVKPLLEAIINNTPPPPTDDNNCFKMIISSIDYDPHLKRISIGRISQGTIRAGDKIILTDQPNKRHAIERIFVFKGLERVQVKEAFSGEIVAIAGIHESKIGDTLSGPSDTTPLPIIEIGEPTLHITLGPNTSPFIGNEGEFTTSRQLEERIDRELEKNLSLRVEKKSDGKFLISGRGELHIAIFLENLRREGYEMEVGRPEVIVKRIDGIKKEPIEELSIIVPNEHVGTINQELGKRYATLVKMEPINEKEVEFIYQVPTRAILNLRSTLLTTTKGTALLSSQLIGYEPIGKQISKTRVGALMASGPGVALSYGINAAQQRGIIFIAPGTKVYEGMIIGKNAKDEEQTCALLHLMGLSNLPRQPF